MNILFTNFCNRSCPYCFAKGKLNSVKKLKESYMSLRNLKIVIKFLKKSKQKDIGIIGGEPTLHPMFKEAIKMLLDEGFFITIYSNGIINRNIVEFLNNIDRKRWNMLLNINQLKSYAQIEWVKIIRTMRTLHRQIELGFTIYKINFDMDFIINLIKKYNLRRRTRVGLANPIWGQNNKYLSLKSYKKVAPKIVQFAKKCNDLNILLNFDCGFTLCSFTKKECGELFYYNSSLSIECSPIIDVGPDLTVWRCFSTSMIWNKKLTDFKDLQQIHDFYNNKFATFCKMGTMNKCFKCKHLKRGQCGGGCLGYTLKSFNFEEGLPELF